MNIIVDGGSARIKAMDAVKLANEGKIKEARTLLKESNEDINKAHRAQTDLIQSEARGDRVEVSLFMVHAQDHLMNAMTVRDLAKELVNLHEKHQKNCL